MFNDTVTLYNKYMVDGAEKWQRTVLRGVYWNAIKGAVLRKTGTASADSVMVVIPRVLPGYMKPKVWEADGEKSRSWTLRAGDTLVKGEVDADVTRSLTKELAALDDVLTITTVDDMDFGGHMGHFEVSGR